MKRDKRGFDRRKFLERACEIVVKGTELDLRFYVHTQELKHGAVVLDTLEDFSRYLEKEQANAADESSGSKR